MEKHCFGGGLRHSLHGKQLFNRRLPNGADRLEGAQQRPCARFADAFNLGQRADQRVFFVLLLMIADGKAVHLFLNGGDKRKRLPFRVDSNLPAIRRDCAGAMAVILHHAK